MVRRFRGREMVAEAVADLLDGTELDPVDVLAGLEAAGYMEKVRLDTDGDIWWDSTIHRRDLDVLATRVSGTARDASPMAGAGQWFDNLAPTEQKTSPTVRLIAALECAKPLQHQRDAEEL